MKHKLIPGLNCLWAGFTAFTFPICFLLIYLDLTGHGKGYSYDLGPEKDISVMFGIFELLVWLALALPSNIYVLRRAAKKNRLLLIAALVLYAALAAACILAVFGGWGKYAKEVFNI